MNTAKPYIFAVDDDPQVSRAIQRDLRKKYNAEYRVLTSISVLEAESALSELKNQGAEIALFLSDQRMPDMLGVEFLSKAREVFPKAKRVLLTAYSDTDAAIRAINEAELDYYLLKPWDPPEEKLYPVLDDLLDEWNAGRNQIRSGLRVIGTQYDPRSHKIKDFLSSNLFPYHWIDKESTAAAELLSINKLEGQGPFIFFEDGSHIHQPELPDVAQRLGLNSSASNEVYDVAIIGAGPAGLAAGVYGGSEGLETVLIEKHAPGGQAGTSSRIENYLGFPKGLSGQDLARRAITQATRFGTEFLSPSQVENITIGTPLKTLNLSGGKCIHAKSVIITTGVSYRQLDTPGVKNLTGAGIYYGAATTEATTCTNKDVFVIGGGNSAGQGAVYLSRFARKVRIVIRRPDLTSSMSSYLIDQIDAIDNIEVIGRKELVEAKGDGHLEGLVFKDLDNDAKLDFEAQALFIFIGAKPFTDWIDLPIIRDEKGFLKTGGDLLNLDEFKQTWKLERDPYPLETNIPGVFAAGDVRSGAMNRVASAVGEGAMSVSFVHRYLNEV
ncbi:FAD-dependent oxidoreductase [Phaeocystidibacter luteus]|uniref:Response regulator n=1 Tax=Phaeocystidibacter luteus TaxID=911197 RepID=A0A6N6RGQ2_9FLAO|nr:FAD-dependent oxidoreductase [Phaeocystidibacter luteus]KAB2809923.1 response regulator [Phaeocystidibacter luteus]